MSSATRQKIEELVADLARDPAFQPSAPPPTVLPAAAESQVQLAEGSHSLSALPATGRGFQ